MRFSFLSVVVGLTLSAACSPSGTDVPPMDALMHEMNPFFTVSTLPHAVPPFDQIDDARYLPAFERRIAEQLDEVEAIANASEPSTFDNTLIPLERSGRLLGRVATGDEGVESHLVEHTIQPLVEQVGRTPRQIRRGDPYRRLPHLAATFTHGPFLRF